MATQNLGTSASLSGADAVLKEYYPSAIVEQLNNKTFLLDQIERDSEHIDFTGRRAIIPLHRNRNRGRSSIGDGGNLPTAGKQDWTDAVVQIRYHASAIEISDAAIAATKNNDGAFVSLLEAETKGVATDLKKDINRQVFGTGDGILASCVSNTGTTTAVITVSSAQYIQVGDTVDIVVKSTGAAIAGGAACVVTARNTATPTVSVTTTATVSVSSIHGLALSGGAGSNSALLEMDGLRNIAATTGRTLHGVDSSNAANAFWDPQVIAAGGAVTDALLLQLIDKVGQTGQGEIDTIITTRGIRRAYAASLTNNRRYNDAAAVKLHTGYTAIMVNEIPIITDDDAPKGFVFGFDKKAFKWFELAKPGFLEQDSGIFTLKDGTVAGTKASIWQAYFRWYAAFGCVAPNRTGALTGVTDEAPV